MTKSWSWEDCGEPNKPREDETIHVPKTEPSIRSDWPHSRISYLLFAWLPPFFGNRSVWSWTIWKFFHVFPCLSMSFHVFKVKAWQACRPRWPQWIQTAMTVTASPNFPFSPATSPHTLLLLCFAGRNTSPHLESREKFESKSLNIYEYLQKRQDDQDDLVKLW